MPWAFHAPTAVQLPALLHETANRLPRPEGMRTVDQVAPPVVVTATARDCDIGRLPTTAQAIADGQETPDNPTPGIVALTVQLAPPSPVLATIPAVPDTFTPTAIQVNGDGQAMLVRLSSAIR